MLVVVVVEVEAEVVEVEEVEVVVVVVVRRHGAEELEGPAPAGAPPAEATMT